MSNETDAGRGTLVGGKAPPFSGKAVVGGAIRTISLDDYKRKWKVLFFYPLDFTFVCPTEITAFSDKIGLFEKLGAQVVGCSVDSEFAHLQWTRMPRNEGGLGDVAYALLSDIDKGISRSYGVLMDGSVALRATFVIDDGNVVQHASVNNLGVGRNVEEVARLVEGYQYTAKHGEVCPSDWRPGGKTMKPDPEGSKEYFEKLEWRSPPAGG